ncbi:MAG: endonuclease/exonuclease/phosphatase family protein [Burkholderiales bacterium]|nr:endonuclease/exonuclease/phosphatase family protein [Phycisphaerae bacterium]
MYEPKREPRVTRRTVTITVLLILFAAVSYVGLAKWPAGGAVGDGAALTATTRPVAPASVRLATWNIHSGIGQDLAQDLARTARLLEGFDLAGLQETRGYIFSKSQVDELGAALTLNSLFSPNEWTRFHNEFGNALLTRLPVESWERVPLPGTQSSHHRNLLIVRTRIGDVQLTVNIVHMDRTVDRAAQLEKVWEIFSKQAPPCVIMGDFNTRFDDPLLQPFLAGSLDAVGAITPESKPPRVDWIFTRGLHVIGVGIRETDASDHPLVWAELSLPAQ